ncbi:secretion protein EspG [Mycobacterium vulneris]|uniref:ESX secretion-associated protein EspG n=1 Tax=Mycolicibacterium porcinum TaxID=39693 RepID=A0AAP7VF76_9MYCO|nr:ESX secretion-associated protein EspG [Mycolicibacterium porcinum]MBX8688393.1 ESX secretion-associated protein EspG [Mycobacterium sp. 20091114027_K0903767]OCB48463.1 secretion protein EspG [Mycolicibacterium vulneris]MCV7390862.1 ESX secretion-associated protein EspG [Mycolicibacterium porcinum]OCB08563.1 secretion protein EspG [Mycolicibacterium porcinum]OCB57610.1 secretion protein EspG [Mycolicibacterium vulneris]
MTNPFSADANTAAIDDVVGAELTIDGILVVADKLGLTDFPPSMGIRLNIPQPDLRKTVWEQVERDLMAQGVLDVFGSPHPEVAAMLDTLSRPERTLEGRWWRRDVGGKMIRFVVCRKGGRHVVAARDNDMLVLQRVAAQVGLAGMVMTVLGEGMPANVEPLTGVAATLANCRTADELTGYGIPPTSARVYANIISEPESWVELVVSERNPGGTTSQVDVAAGVLDSKQGRIVSIPRRVNGELYGSFLTGTKDNLQRALDGLIEFLPSGSWFDKSEPDSSYLH